MKKYKIKQYWIYNKLGGKIFVTEKKGEMKNNKFYKAKAGFLKAIIEEKKPKLYF